MRKDVECSTHGLRRAAFVCQHLNKELRVGFHEPFESQENVDYPNGELNAWCDQCHEMLEKTGEWNDESESFAKVKLCCDRCFFEMKRLNLPRKGWKKWFKL